MIIKNTPFTLLAILIPLYTHPMDTHQKHAEPKKRATKTTKQKDRSSFDKWVEQARKKLNNKPVDKKVQEEETDLRGPKWAVQLSGEPSNKTLYFPAPTKK